MSAQVIAFLPETFRLEAVKAGLDDTEIAKRWRKRADWVTRNRGQDATVSIADWQAEIQFAVKDARKLVPRPLSPEESARLRVVHEDQARREREFEEARANAVTFADWIRNVANGTCESPPVCDRCGIDHTTELAKWWLALPEPKPEGSTAIAQWAAARRPGPAKPEVTFPESDSRVGRPPKSRLVTQDACHDAQGDPATGSLPA